MLYDFYFSLPHYDSDIETNEKIIINIQLARIDYYSRRYSWLVKHGFVKSLFQRYS